jgi:hypothetical protein
MTMMIIISVSSGIPPAFGLALSAAAGPHHAHIKPAFYGFSTVCPNFIGFSPENNGFRRRKAYIKFRRASLKKGDFRPA